MALSLNLSTRVFDDPELNRSGQYGLARVQCNGKLLVSETAYGHFVILYINTVLYYCLTPNMNVYR